MRRADGLARMSSPNVQFAIKDGDPRRRRPTAPSRTVPFVAKATESAIASIAAPDGREPLSNFPMRAPNPEGRRRPPLPLPT